MARLTLIRGLPGSGKSTVANDLALRHGDTYVLENDDYFNVAYTEGIEYVFDKRMWKDASARCRNLTEKLVMHDDARVIVANTFITLKSMHFYRGLGSLPMVDFRVITCVGEYGSTHNVPEDVMENMRLKWEPLPNEEIWNG